MSKIIGTVRPMQWAKEAQTFFKTRSVSKQAEKMVDIIVKGDREAINLLRSLKSKTPEEWKKNAAIGNAFVRALQLGTNEVSEEN